jgi:hypothetical protein
MVARTEIRAARRRGASSATVLLLAAVTAACGGGGTSPAPTAPAAPTGQALPAETVGFCSAAVDLAAVVHDGPDIADAPGAREDVAAAFAEYQARLEPPLTAMEQATPPALRQDITTIARQARYAVATNDEAPLGTPEFDSAVSRLRAFMITECRFEQVRVTAAEYRFEGVPPTLPAGTVAFTMSNQGAETHELDVYRINEGVPQPFPELVVLPDDRRDVLLTSVGEISTNPGATDTEFMTLIPGRYGIACPVPQGTTPEADGTGPPHATLGMVAEFTVT